MKKQFVLALMLASGMALAQSSGSIPGSSDQQQPSSQQPSSQQPSSQQPSTQPQQPSSQSPTSAGQNSLTGCLKGSDGNWVLVAEGQSTPIKGDSSTLSPHNGHQVQVKGSQASDGSFQVTDVIMISETCTKRDESSSSGVGAAAGATTGAVTGAASSTASATKDAASDAAQATKSAANDAASSAQSATAPKTYSDQTPSQSTSQSAGQTAGQSAGQTAGQPAGKSSGQKLPQTASPLPLLGLLGLASLVSGLIMRRK